MTASPDTTLTAVRPVRVFFPLRNDSADVRRQSSLARGTCMDLIFFEFRVWLDVSELFDSVSIAFTLEAVDTKSFVGCFCIMTP